MSERDSPGDAGRQGQKRKFTPDEDLTLRTLVERCGTKSWEDIAKEMPGRTARQCRDRYNNYLLGSLVMSPWTPEEDAIIVERYRQIGPKWVAIARQLHGRSGNHVKNRWHRHLAARDADPGLAHSGEDSSEWEEEAQEEKPSIPLCPAIRLAECDWVRFFDAVEKALGYGPGFRNRKGR
jgi:hypothetical protein